MTEAQAQIQRLNDARAKIEEDTEKKSRKLGQLEELKKSTSELEARAKDEFDSSREELPELLDSLKETAETKLVELETVLEINGRRMDKDDTPDDESENETADEPVDEDALV